MRPADQIARDEIRGDATDAEVAWLNDHLEAWRDGLVAVIQDLAVQFTNRKAEAAAFKAECFANGRDGRQRWSAYQGEEGEWRGRANGLNRRLSKRLREVKQMIHEQAQANNGHGLRRKALIDEIRALLDSDEACVCDRIGNLIDQYDGVRGEDTAVPA